MSFPEASTPKSSRRGTVLVVEDDEDIREFAVDALRVAGYEVCEAANGRSAFEILRSERAIDLLLTDVRMPGGMSGQEVAVEAQARRSRLPVLYASGVVPDALLRGGRLKSHESFIAKPYSADELVRSVQGAIAQERPS